jgi:FG-GAP-like repeat/Bacterial Ig-like domain (group 3)
MFARGNRGYIFRFSFSLVLLLASALPSRSQVLKVSPVLYPSGGQGAGNVVLADVNKDGKLDAIVPNNSGPIGILFGNGDGTFQKAVTYPAASPGSGSIAVADLNGDGWPDLAAVSADNTETSSHVSVLLNKGDGTFNTAVGYAGGGSDGSSITVADVNGDGHPDLVLTNECTSGLCRTGSLGVLLGNGDGTFGPVTTYPMEITPTGVVVADLNNDGHPDLLVAESNSTEGLVTVMLNAGDGTFPTKVKYPSGGVAATSIMLADVNGDGKLDAIVTNAVFIANQQSNGSVGVLLGDGDGTFKRAVAYATDIGAFSGATGDFNGDGAPDVVVTGGTPSDQTVQGYVEVLMNDGHGKFRPATTKYSTRGLDASSVAVANLNADGNPDVVVSECDGFQRTCPMGALAVFLGKADKTSTALTSSTNPSSMGQAVTFTATVTAASGGPIPDGTTVTFLSSGKKIGSATTTNGIATLTISSLAPGMDPVKASSSSSAFFIASSATLEQVVN